MVGVGLIVFSLILAWQVFSGHLPPPQIFHLSAISLDLGQSMGIPTQAKSEIISADLVNKPLDLTAFLFFMGFVASGGAKVATIGTQLVRTIKVDLKSE